MEGSAATQELAEVWVTPALLEALTTRRVRCSAVMFERQDDGTYRIGFQTTALEAKGYSFPVVGEDAEKIAARRG